jgi:hypothetical protein
MELFDSFWKLLFEFAVLAAIIWGSCGEQIWHPVAACNNSLPTGPLPTGQWNTQGRR